MENRDQQLDQLLKGVYRLCVNMDDCFGCPFHKNKCMLGELKPKTWFDEETIQAPVESHKPVTFVAEEPKVPAPAPEPEPSLPPVDDDANGTWILSTSMGSVFSKYYSTDVALLEAGEEQYLALIVRMPEEVGNEANYRGKAVPKVELGVIVEATQVMQ